MLRRGVLAARAVARPAAITRPVLAAAALPARVTRPAPLACRAISTSSTLRAAGDPHVNLDEFNSKHWDHGGWETIDRNSADPSGRTFNYMVMGAGKFLYASMGRAAVLKGLTYWSPAGDVMAMASLEVDISKIVEGTALTVIWRGKPVFIRHRTAREIESARADDSSSELKDPQTDAARVKDAQWLIVVGICTHFGCVPMNGQGAYGGWFCPCHGSHYDTSGRIRRGPAPLNLEVPQYSFMTPQRVLLGSKSD